MMCYRDRTYCSYNTCLKFGACSRALTLAVRDAASELHLEVCEYLEKPPCYEPSMDSVAGLQSYIGDWAVSKGWAGKELTPQEKECEYKLAKIALLHGHLDHLAEQVRKNPYLDVEMEQNRQCTVSVPHSSDYDTPHVLGKLALMHTEVTEALEAFVQHGVQAWKREDGKPEGFASELADIIIRVLELGAELGIPIEDAIEEKLSYNDGRPYRHGKFG